MGIKQLLGIAAVSLAASSAQAQVVVGPYGPGNLGYLDNLYAVLIGYHPQDFVGFADNYLFSVHGPSGLFSTIIPLSVVDATIPAADAATISAIVLYDGAGGVLGIDFDGSNGYTINALLPTAGTYDLVVVGLGGSGAGAYVSLTGTASLVPEPASLVMALLGLPVLGWYARWRRLASARTAAAAIA